MSPETGHWMPMYWSAYFGDTMHLTTEEHGAYLLLLGTYWKRAKALPDDDDFLSTVTKLSRKRWRIMRQKISEFFVIKDGEWKHQRVEIEILRSSERLASARANGRAGGLAKSKLSTSTLTLSSNEERKDISLKCSSSAHGPEPELPTIGNSNLTAFDSWYAAYPRKVGKGQARKAYLAASKKVSEAILLEGGKRYAKEVFGKDPKFVKHPATWLNGECWADAESETPEKLRAKRDEMLAKIYGRDLRVMAENFDKVCGQDFYKAIAVIEECSQQAHPEIAINKWLYARNKGVSVGNLDSWL